MWIPTTLSCLKQVAGPAPGVPAGVALDPQPGKPLSVPLVSGTPRYLLFRYGGYDVPSVRWAVVPTGRKLQWEDT